MLVAIDAMLAEAAGALPTAAGWRFEPKYDGVRVAAYVRADRIELLSRRGKSLTAQFPDVVEPLARLRADVGSDFVLDGEIVAKVSDGLAGFQMLQSRLGVENRFRIRMLTITHPAVLVAFDVLQVGPTPLLEHALRDRRQVLEALLGGRATGVRMADQADDGPAMLERSLAECWEGLVAKREDSRYMPGQRSPRWLKVKAAARQEFVIAGYTRSTAEREFAALVLGYHDHHGALVYAGCVGSGFTRRDIAAVHRRLAPREMLHCPLASPPHLDDPVCWTEPRIVAEVRFAAWTEAARLRFPVFIALRDDKDPRAVVRET